MKINHRLIIGGIISLLIIGGVVLIASNKASAPEPNPAASNSATPAAQPDTNSNETPKLIIGNPAAKLTIVEYGDFQCPFCEQFFRQTEPQLLSEYINTSKAKLEFRVETHIGEESVLAGEAAYCANDQKAFKPYHYELYKRQEGYNSGTFSNVNLKRIAGDLKLDQVAFDTCLDSHKYLSTVQASHAEAQQKGVTSTPTIFIGDRKVSGAQPFSVYKALIDAQL